MLNVKYLIEVITTHNYSSTTNTTIRIQTFPLRNGQLQLIVDAFESGANSQSFQFNTTADPLPFGITYAVFGDLDINTTAKYYFRDGKYMRIIFFSHNFVYIVDRLPKVFPLADCREGYNTGLTVGSDNTTVSIEYLDITDPVSISNVHWSQLWCIHKRSEDCPCGGSQTRNHIELNAKGKVRHMGTCKYLKAEPPTEYNNGSVTVTVSKILVF